MTRAGVWAAVLLAALTALGLQVRRAPAAPAVPEARVLRVPQAPPVAQSQRVPQAVPVPQGTAATQAVPMTPAATPATTLASAASATPATPAQAAAMPPAPQTLDHGFFTDVTLYAPAGAVQQVVFQLVDRSPLTPAEQALQRAMVAAGAMVVAVPMQPFSANMAANSGACGYAAGSFENLSRHLQASRNLPTYFEPMLVGAAGYAAYAYALLAQAPAGTFSSALSVDFCPRLEQALPLCTSPALRWHPAASGSGFDLEPAPSLGAPWTVLQSGAALSCTAQGAQAFVSNVAQARWLGAPGATPATSAGAVPASAAAAVPAGFEAAYQQLAAKRLALEAPPAALAGLPLIEVPTTRPGSRFAVLLSGDGGWAGIDKEIAAALADQGVPVAGVDSLRYFWTARTPEGLTADLDRLVRYYAARWQRSEVLLIGFSQGADVLPFAVNRLGARTRAAVRLTTLIGPGQKASFEFHVANWLGPSGDKPILPEAQKLAAAGTLCIYGSSEPDSLCPQLAPSHARVLALPGGHHFGGDYAGLVAHILKAAGP